MGELDTSKLDSILKETEILRMMTIVTEEIISDRRKIKKLKSSHKSPGIDLLARIQNIEAGVFRLEQLNSKLEDLLP